MSQYQNSISPSQVRSTTHATETPLGSQAIRNTGAMLDSISVAQQKENKGKQDGFERVTLPEGKGKEKDYLLVLAKAFGSIYENMAQTVIAQNTEFARVQNVSEEMLSVSLKANQNAITTQEKAALKEQHAMKEDVKYEKATAIFNGKWFTYLAKGFVNSCSKLLGKSATNKLDEELDKYGADIGSAIITVSMVALAIGTSLADGGATAGLVPEAIEMTEMGAETADSAVDAVAQASENVEEVPELEEGVESVELGSPMSQDASVVEQAIEEAPQELSQTEENADNTQSEESYQKQARETFSNKDPVKEGSWLSKSAKAKATRMFFSAHGTVFATLPMTMHSFSSLEIAKYMRAVAAAQKPVGNAVSFMRVSSAYYQFYQQFANRSGEITGDLIDGLANVIDTATATFKGYRQIAYGLAQAA